MCNPKHRRTCATTRSSTYIVMHRPGRDVCWLTHHRRQIAAPSPIRIVKKIVSPARRQIRSDRRALSTPARCQASQRRACSGVNSCIGFLGVAVIKTPGMRILGWETSIFESLSDVFRHGRCGIIPQPPQNDRGNRSERGHGHPVKGRRQVSGQRYENHGNYPESDNRYLRIVKLHVSKRSLYSQRTLFKNAHLSVARLHRPRHILGSVRSSGLFFVRLSNSEQPGLMR